MVQPNDPNREGDFRVARAVSGTGAPQSEASLLADMRLVRRAHLEADPALRTALQASLAFEMAVTRLAAHDAYFQEATGEFQTVPEG